MIEQNDYKRKIIFEDVTFNIDIDLADKSQSIGSLLSSLDSAASKNMIYSMIITDIDGTELAKNTPTALLSRLKVFKVYINGGEKVYLVNNLNYLANGSSDIWSKNHTEDELDAIFSYMRRYHFTFNEAKSILNINRKKSLSSLISSIRSQKYEAIEKYLGFKAVSKQNRSQRLINTFFYAASAQIIGLNLCTFVFFSWDVMEPITACLTYANLIAGYYFSSISKHDYEFSEFGNWLNKTRSDRSLARFVEEEKEVLDRFLIEDERVSKI